MSSIGKLRKNAENYKLNEIYRNMTPEQYQRGIQLAIQNTQNELVAEYNLKLQKMQDKIITDMTKKMDNLVSVAVNMTSIKFLYELGKQLDCFIDVPEYMDQKIDLVQEISEHIMINIENYDKEAFNKKRKLVEQIFKIKFQI